MNAPLFLCIGFCLMNGVLSHPAKGNPLSSTHQNCIQLTPEKEAEINLFVEKITNFLLNLTAEHEEFDITFIKVDIERHSNDEDDEKEIELQLSVNDCAKTDETFEKDKHVEVIDRKVNNEPKKDVHIDKPVKKLSNDNKKGDLLEQNQQNVTSSHINKDLEKSYQKPNNCNGKITVNPEQNRRNYGDVNKNSDKSDYKTHQEKNQQNKVNCNENKNSDEHIEIGSVENNDDDVEREPNNTAPKVVELNLGSDVQKLLKEIKKKKGSVYPLLILLQEHEDYVIIN